MLRRWPTEIRHSKTTKSIEALAVTFWRSFDEVFERTMTKVIIAIVSSSPRKVIKKSVIFEKFRSRKNVEIEGLVWSRQEVSNAYLVVKIGFDTEENEPFEVRDKKWGSTWRTEFVQVTNRIRRSIHVGHPFLHGPLGGRDDLRADDGRRWTVHSRDHRAISTGSSWDLRCCWMMIRHKLTKLWWIYWRNFRRSFED